MTGGREIVVTPEAHIEQVLRLEAERDQWAAKRPPWRVYVGCVVGALTVGALLPFARGVLAGLVVAGVVVVPTQLLIRRVRLQDIDRRLKKLRDCPSGYLSGEGG